MLGPAMIPLGGLHSGGYWRIALCQLPSVPPPSYGNPRVSSSFGSFLNAGFAEEDDDWTRRRSGHWLSTLVSFGNGEPRFLTRRRRRNFCKWVALRSFGRLLLPASQLCPGDFRFSGYYKRRQKARESLFHPQFDSPPCPSPSPRLL